MPPYDAFRPAEARVPAVATIRLSDGSATVTRHDDIASRLVSPRPVDVWVPPDLPPGTRLPVVYAHDGQHLFDPSFPPRDDGDGPGVDWGLDEAVSRLMAEGAAAGAVLVGVWCGEARMRDYAPQGPLEALRGTPSWKPTWDALLVREGGPPHSDAYLRYLVEDLKPVIDRRYPTLPGREHTFLMGSSLGGLVSLYAVERYPDVFGGAACLSTHWPLGGDALVDAMGAALPPPGRHRLYFDHGTESLDADYGPFQRRMDGHLRAAGYREGEDWLTLEFPGTGHHERWWRARADVPLRFLLGP